MNDSTEMLYQILLSIAGTVILLLVTTTAWFMKGVWRQVNSGFAEMRTGLAGLDKEVAEIRGSLATGGERMGTHAVRLDDHESRIRTLEHARAA